MERAVVHLPAPVLGAEAQPIVDPTHPDAQQLALDLVDTMRAHVHCIGLAAPQIGISLAVFSLDVSAHPKVVGVDGATCHGEFVLFNPELVRGSRAKVGREGCMSVPDLTGDVKRYRRVVVRGTSPDGSERVIEAQGFEAQALQHEMDHLRGLLFLDRVVASDRVFPRKIYR